MHARDIAMPVRATRMAEPAVTALRHMLDSGLPGLVIETGSTFVVVPASQVLRVVVPRYVLDDAALGRVWDEASADSLAGRLADKRVADLLAMLDRDEDAPRHVVTGAANLVELAAVMAAAHVPLVAVVERGRLLGVVTATTVIERILR